MWRWNYWFMRMTVIRSLATWRVYPPFSGQRSHSSSHFTQQRSTIWWFVFSNLIFRVILFTACVWSRVPPGPVPSPVRGEYPLGPVTGPVSSPVWEGGGTPRQDGYPPFPRQDGGYPPGQDKGGIPLAVTRLVCSLRCRFVCALVRLLPWLLACATYKNFSY